MSCVGREIIGNEADGKAGSGARSSRAGTGKPERRWRPVSTGEPGGQPARCHRRRAWGAPRKPPGAEPSCWGHSCRVRRPYAPLTGEGGRVQTWPWALTTSQLSPSGEGTRPRTGGVRSAAEASSSSLGSSRGLGDKGVKQERVARAGAARRGPLAPLRRRHCTDSAEPRCQKYPDLLIVSRTGLFIQLSGGSEF